MLILTRKVEESVVVGAADFRQLLSVTVLGVDGGKVRLGFRADRSVAVHRWEVWQRIAQSAGVPPGPAPPGAADAPGQPPPDKAGVP
jgi:carbon storage regulator